MYDANERVIAQTTAPLGGRILQSQIAKQKSAEQTKSLLPDSPKPLSSQSTQPFSLIFDKVPQDVLDKPDVMYRVEIADKKGDDAAAASN